MSEEMQNIKQLLANQAATQEAMDKMVKQMLSLQKEQCKMPGTLSQNLGAASGASTPRSLFTNDSAYSPCDGGGDDDEDEYDYVIRCTRRYK